MVRLDSSHPPSPTFVETSSQMQPCKGTRYTYTSLQCPRHIRVIDLRPSAIHAAPLRFSFVQIDLSQAKGSYEAISYAWGSEEPARPVYLKDETHLKDKAYVLVTTNLEEILRWLRLREKSRRLWADAICIDQSNMEEKQCQLPLMKDIFTESSRVLACMGFCQKYVMALQAWKSYLELLANVPIVRTGYGHAEDRYRAFRKALIEKRCWRSMQDHFEKLASSPWFERRWIVQEVVFNPHVTLWAGDQHISWDHFITVLHYLRLCSWPALGLHTPVTENGTSSAFQKVWSIDNLRDCHSGFSKFGPGGFDPNSSAILSLLYEYRLHRCKDDRDRIYALYNLASDIALTKTEKSRGKVHLDVDSSLNTHEVYKALTLACLHAKSHMHIAGQTEAYIACLFSRQDMTKFLDLEISFDNTAHILNTVLSHQFSRRADEWPSWVPDWRLEYSTPHDELLSGWDAHFVEELSKHRIKVALWCAWRPTHALLLHTPLSSLVSDLGVDEYPTITAVYGSGDLMNDGHKLYFNENLNKVLCSKGLLPRICPFSLVLEAMSAFWPRNFTNLAWTSLDKLAFLENFGAFFKANIGSLTFFGVGNKTMRVGDLLHSYQHNIYLNEHPDIGVHKALILHPISRENPHEWLTYRLLGSAGLLGPFMEGQPFRACDGSGQFAEVCLV